MVGRAVFLLILIFVINFVFVGLGLASESDLNTVSPISQNIDTIGDNANKVETNIEVSEGGGVVSDSLPSLNPDSGNTYDNYKYMKNNIGNFVWGYKNVFVNVGLPGALVFLFTGIIAILQIYCIFIIGSAIISIFTGGSSI